MNNCRWMRLAWAPHHVTLHTIISSAGGCFIAGDNFSNCHAYSLQIPTSSWRPNTVTWRESAALACSNNPKVKMGNQAEDGRDVSLPAAGVKEQGKEIQGSSDNVACTWRLFTFYRRSAVGWKQLDFAPSPAHHPSRSQDLPDMYRSIFWPHWAIRIASCRGINKSIYWSILETVISHPVSGSLLRAQSLPWLFVYLVLLVTHSLCFVWCCGVRMEGRGKGSRGQIYSPCILWRCFLCIRCADAGSFSQEGPMDIHKRPPTTHPPSTSCSSDTTVSLPRPPTVLPHPTQCTLRLPEKTPHGLFFQVWWSKSSRAVPFRMAQTCHLLRHHPLNPWQTLCACALCLPGKAQQPEAPSSALCFCSAVRSSSRKLPAFGLFQARVRILSPGPKCSNSSHQALKTLLSWGFWVLSLSELWFYVSEWTMTPSQQTTLLLPPRMRPPLTLPPYTGRPAWQVALARITDHVYLETVSVFDSTKNCKHSILLCHHFRQSVEINLWFHIYSTFSMDFKVTLNI